jgi:hypothetical protein
MKKFLYLRDLGDEISAKTTIVSISARRSGSLVKLETSNLKEPSSWTVPLCGNNLHKNMLA